MSQTGAIMGLAILIGWLLSVIFGLFLPTVIATPMSVVYAAACVWLLRNNIALTGAIAVLTPLGVMMPALALRHMLVGLGFDIPGFLGIEVAVFLIAYTAFLCAAFGLIPIDLYRLGYDPRSVAVFAFCLCLYAFFMGNWFLAFVVVSGQFVWMMRWGSSNWFDQMTHVLLWPVALVVLITRLI
ncbi:MAG: hypothetical protein AAF066_05555 [Pseudomonadota bacterium]